MDFSDLLSSLFHPATVKKATLSKDEVASLLKTNPDILKEFEEAYARIPDGDIEPNAKDMAGNGEREGKGIDYNMVERVVKELLAKTQVYTYTRENDKAGVETLLPGYDEPPVTVEEINNLPTVMRPQLTGNLMSVHMNGPSYPLVLWYYKKYQESHGHDRSMYYHFRQGLDILDLDEVIYRIIDTNRTSMGHWLPQLVEANRRSNFFKIPSTTIARVPLTLLQLTRQEYAMLTPATMKIVDQWAMEAFHLEPSKEYFVKTGTYSSKFDFRNCHVAGENEVKELGEYLLYIHFAALQKAGPLYTPIIFGMSTTTEWVVREFIPDKEHNPCIYHGMPLHTEYRVFVDCDENVVIGCAPYWEPETMTTRFSTGTDANSPHQMHDYVIYKSHEDTLMERFFQNRDKVVEEIEKILPNLDLEGQWSIDVMQNGKDFWLIDMALAENSAFYREYVPRKWQKHIEEDWMPKIGKGD